MPLLGDLNDRSHPIRRIPMKIAGKDVAIALSLANICYLRIWTELLAVSTAEAYYLDVANADVIAAVANVVLLAAVFLASTVVARRFGRAGHVAIVTGFVAVLVVQLNSIGPELAPGVLAIGDRWRAGAQWEAITAVLLLGAIVAAAARWPRRSLDLALGAVLIFSPFVAVTFGRAALILTMLNPSRALAPDAPLIGAPVVDTDGPRVVVIVMDALGRRHSVEARPAGLDLPEFDRLRAGSIDASQVTQIGSVTKISIPGMLTGLAVQASEPSSADELLLTVDGQTRNWSTEPNLFDEAKRLGGVAVVTGWYHPYCRLFANLDGCASFPARTIGSRGRHTGFLRAMRDQQIALLPYVNLRIRAIDIFTEQRADATIAATTGDRGLVFLHLILPHTPWIWDETTESFTLTRFEPDGYFGNIKLMDRVLGDLRREMEAAGKWDSTAVLLLSDHVVRYRPKYLGDPVDLRVPFILKLPGQTSGAVYDRPFSALVTHDLVVALLRGELKTVGDATAWLDSK